MTSNDVAVAVAWPPPSAQGHQSFEIRHSAIDGFGAFAVAPIRAGARVIEYVGERISKAESLRRCAGGNNFIFELNSDWDLDGLFSWNTARFFNHSCAPNCDAERIDERIWIAARRDIAPGEELTYNYGYDLEGYREHPCRCGMPECVGYIVAAEFFAQFRRQSG